jgi:hypothetical protein
VPPTASSGRRSRRPRRPAKSWEFVDTARAAAARESAAQYPENRSRPVDAQGGWFGGRVILPGDPDYNRGSLSPKGR